MTAQVPDTKSKPFKLVAILASIFGGLLTVCGLASVIYFGGFGVILLIPALLLLGAGVLTLRRGPTTGAAVMVFVLAAIFGLIFVAIANDGMDTFGSTLVVLAITLMFLSLGVMLVRGAKQDVTTQEEDVVMTPRQKGARLKTLAILLVSAGVVAAGIFGAVNIAYKVGDKKDFKAACLPVVQKPVDDEILFTASESDDLCSCAYKAYVENADFSIYEEGMYRAVVAFETSENLSELSNSETGATLLIHLTYCEA